MTNEATRHGILSKRGLLGITSCILGIGVVYFGFNLGQEPIKKDAAASAQPATEAPTRYRPVRAMNLALGNMVYFAHDLGFTVKTTNAENFDGGRIALRIENQLQDLRDIYRQQSVNDASLVGGMMLQFDIDRSGAVVQIKDVSSTITDLDFRRSVVGEVAKWSFNDIVSEPMTVTCPLLFVHEGMDITTLVQWEKALGHFAGKGTPVRVAAGAKPQPKQSETLLPPITGATTAATTAAENPVQVKDVKAERKIFQIKYPTSLRKDPNFSSTSLMTFTIGTKVVLINGRGDWLEVKAFDNNLSGFIRKEFVTPFDVVRK